MTIDTLEKLKRRELAVETAFEIMSHPAYGGGRHDVFQLAVTMFVERALEKWSKGNGA